MKQVVLSRAFFSLFVLSLGPKRKELKKQLETEIEAQIRRVLPLLEDKEIRLDGHQHIQMIPVMMKSIRDVIHKMNLKVSYIRYSTEPLSPYIKHTELWKDYKIINIIKNIVLNVFGWLDRPVMKEMGLPTNMIMGLVISGNLEQRLVEALLPDFKKIADKKNKQLELVMHPGYGMKSGEGIDKKGGIFEQFYLDDGRKREYDCLLNIGR